MLVTSSTECAQHCIMDKQCESLNYHHPNVKTLKSSCELNNTTKKESKETFEEDVTTTYYYFIGQVIYINSYFNFSKSYRTSGDGLLYITSVDMLTIMCGKGNVQMDVHSPAMFVFGGDDFLHFLPEFVLIKRYQRGNT